MFFISCPDPTRKVRYLALTAIIPRLGAKTLLSMRPNLIPELLLATSQVRPVGGAVSMMLGVLWSTLKKECANDNATASSHWDAEKEFIASWSPHLAAALCSRDDSLRQAACLYALPSLFTLEPTAIDVLLGEIAHAAVDVSVSDTNQPTIINVHPPSQNHCF
jgi:thyroid adenoma-associated protein